MNGDDLGTAALITGALTFVLPPLVAWLRSYKAPAWVVGLIFFAVCFGAAALNLFLQDQILNPPAFDSARDLVKYYALNLLAVITAARVWYATFWKTVAAGALDGLENSGPRIGDDKQ